MRAFKTEIDPNAEQMQSLLQHAGAARWAYNFGLRRKQEERAAGRKSPTAIDLHRELNRLKKLPVERGGVPWMYEVSKAAPQEALRNLDNAFKHFFRRCKSGAKRKGYPRFKSRKRGIGSFTLTGAIKVCDRSIQLPRLGSIRIKEMDYLPVGAHGSATVSEWAGRWFVSIRVNATPDLQTGTEVLGCDVGIKHLAVLSDGTVFKNPKALQGAAKRLRMLQKAVSRRKKGGANRRKAVQAVAKQHYRIACIRSDALHQVTSVITKRAAVLCIETLNMAGMLRNHCLAQALSDASLSELHRQFRYKMAWRGGKLVEAGRFYPSSKTCSDCGHVLARLDLGTREWCCPACGSIHDRDVNAAVNLKNLAASSAVTAYCPGSSGRGESLGETAGWVGTNPHG